MTDSKKYIVPKEFNGYTLGGKVVKKDIDMGFVSWLYEVKGKWEQANLQQNGYIFGLEAAGKLIEVEDEPDFEFREGQEVYILQSTAYIACVLWSADDFDSEYAQGNVFATEAEALEKAAKNKARATIEHYARRKWGKFVPDWDNEDEDQYSVFVRGASFIEAAISVRALGQMYFGKRSHAQEIIDKLTPELKILFGVK
jgi:hypothetical protein